MKQNDFVKLVHTTYRGRDIAFGRLIGDEDNIVVMYVTWSNDGKSWTMAERCEEPGALAIAERMLSVSHENWLKQYYNYGEGPEQVQAPMANSSIVPFGVLKQI